MSEVKRKDTDISILYRCNQKYFDKKLSKYDITYTQFIFLTQIYEDEGISMNKLASNGVFDKGTITKSIQRLEQLEYVKVVDSEVDKRAKLLFTTNKAQEMMPELYGLRQEWQTYISENVDEEDMDKYNEVLGKLIEKAREYSNFETEDSIKLFGIQKLTLLDYPGHMASTVFTGGCNFRCPFCHNKSLVFLNENNQELIENDIIDFLDSRTKILDGICITGGEPTLHKGLKDFIKKIRSLGLKVKLDTNGSSPEKLKELIDEGLLDYVAMDIKNSLDKYSQTIGLEDYDTSQIKKSVEYLLQEKVDYEFRTTVVSDFHTIKDIEDIGKWIAGAKRYYLQNFEDKGSCISEGLSPVSKEELEKMRDAVKPYVKLVEVRGVEE